MMGYSRVVFLSALILNTTYVAFASDEQQQASSRSLASSALDISLGCECAEHCPEGSHCIDGENGFVLVKGEHRCPPGQCGCMALPDTGKRCPGHFCCEGADGACTHKLQKGYDPAARTCHDVLVQDNTDTIPGYPCTAIGGPNGPMWTKQNIQKDENADWARGMGGDSCSAQSLDSLLADAGVDKKEDSTAAGTVVARGSVHLGVVLFSTALLAVFGRA